MGDETLLLIHLMLMMRPRQEAKVGMMEAKVAVR